MKNLINFLIEWPLKDAFKVTMALWSIYVIKKRTTHHLIRLKTYCACRLADWRESTPEVKEIKELLFYELEKYVNKNVNDNNNNSRNKKNIRSSSSINNRLSILEVGIGFGQNFAYFPNGSVVIGLDPDGLCESYAYERLNQMNKLDPNKNLMLKDYLVGYAENMSIIKSNSIACVVSTNVFDHVEEIEQTFVEIHRVLKPDGLFVYMEPLIFKKRSILINMLLSTIKSASSSSPCQSSTSSSSTINHLINPDAGRSPFYNKRFLNAINTANKIFFKKLKIYYFSDFVCGISVK